MESSVNSIEAESDNDNVKRDNWSGKLEFLMSCISVSVGLGNIWRFPFTAYENGGGVFLIPYIIVLFLIGKPIYYMESLIGQFSSKSNVKVWAACPMFLGIGIGQAYAAMCIMTYYSALIAVIAYYFIGSFESVLPWSYCRPEWQGNCVDSMRLGKLTEETRQQSSSELYFLNVVLRELDDISDGIGVPSWQLTLTLLSAWIVTFCVVLKGVKSLGKASYFLALFPYAILITLLIRAVTLDGAADGIIYFLKPKWGELLNIKIWKEAVVQCFFSLTVGIGPIITLASYNSFDHNIYRDAMIVTTLDTFTSLLSGITIFGILGNLAYNLNVDSIDEVVRSGTGLAFISYPDAIAKFKTVPQLFSVLFFFMLYVLGIGTLAALQSTIITILCDQFKFKKFWKLAIVISTAGFCLGLIYITPGGQWILNLIDYFAGTFVVFCLAIFEVVGILWIYGTQNFCDDAEFMMNCKISIYWRVCWQFLTPILLITIFVYNLATMERLTYGGLEYPLAADIAGWVAFAIGLSQFPLWGIWYISRHMEHSLLKTIKKALSSSSKWGPADPKIKAKWIHHKRKLKEQRQLEDKRCKVNLFC